MRQCEQKTRAFNRAIVVVFSSILLAGVMGVSTLWEVMLCLLACVIGLHLIKMATQGVTIAWQYFVKFAFNAVPQTPSQTWSFQDAILHINERDEAMHVNFANGPARMNVNLKKCRITPVGCFIHLQSLISNKDYAYTTVFVQKSLCSEQAFRAMCRTIIWHTSDNRL